MIRQAFGRTLILEGHTLDSDAAPIDATVLYNVDGGKVIPTDPLKRGQKKVAPVKQKRLIRRK